MKFPICTQVRQASDRALREHPPSSRRCYDYFVECAAWQQLMMQWHKMPIVELVVASVFVRRRRRLAFVAGKNP